MPNDSVARFYMPVSTTI